MSCEYSTDHPRWVGWRRSNATYKPRDSHPAEADQELKDNDTGNSNPLCTQSLAVDTLHGDEKRHGDYTSDSSPEHEPSPAPRLYGEHRGDSADGENGAHDCSNELLLKGRQANTGEDDGAVVDKEVDTWQMINTRAVPCRPQILAIDTPEACLNSPIF